ncbi:MAG: hypothetical protein H7A46_02685 [Verrucomicrobiales bacterium]|nr:hypothetical protein [Verrucomicrobiales bacterium]
MPVYHRIEVVDLTLVDLVTSKTKRNELKRALDAHGENGWTTAQIEEAGGRLLVLMTKQETE